MPRLKPDLEIKPAKRNKRDFQGSFFRTSTTTIRFILYYYATTILETPITGIK